MSLQYHLFLMNHELWGKSRYIINDYIISNFNINEFILCTKWLRFFSSKPVKSSSHPMKPVTIIQSSEGIIGFGWRYFFDPGIHIRFHPLRKKPPVLPMVEYDDMLDLHPSQDAIVTRILHFEQGDFATAIGCGVDPNNTTSYDTGVYVPEHRWNDGGHSGSRVATYLPFFGQR